MNLELRIAIAYLKSHQKRGFISFISWVSILGLVISIMSLITVLSVMNGFQNELKNRILSTISHAYLTNYNQQLPSNTLLINQLKQHPDVLGISPYIEQYALLNYQTKSNGVVIRGIDTKLEPQTSDLLSAMRYGTRTLIQENHILIGFELATLLGVSMGDKITLFTPNIQTAIVGILPRFKRFIVSGIFDAGIEEYNKSLALIRLDVAQKLYQMPNMINGLRLKFTNVLQADHISQSLSKQLDNEHYIVSWITQKQNLIHALNLEKTMISLILFFIIAIASFNLISMMIMVVTDKKDDIAILRTIGMTPNSIMRLFFYQSLLISLLGIFIGTLLGILLSINIETIIAFVETLFNFNLFPTDVFYISTLPSSLQLGDVMATILLALVLCVLAALYPAKKASQTNISQILRHE